MAVTTLSAVKVVYSPHPLRPAADRELHHVALTERDTVRSVIARLGLSQTPLVATLNGREISQREQNLAVRGGDVLVLRQALAGIETTVAAKAFMALEVSWETATVIGAIASFAVSTLASFALSTVLGSLTSRRSNASSVSDNAPDAYSISGGSNGTRPYEPLGITLGRHRVFPDYASRPFGEYVLDPSTTTEVINGTAQTTAMTPPPFGFDDGVPPAVIAPWVLLTTDSINGYGYYGDGAARTYTMTSGTVTRPHTFVVRHSTAGLGTDVATTWEDYQTAGVGENDVTSWQALDVAQQVIQRYGYEITYKTEQLISIFNYGFGDLTISDRRIGSNSLDQYNLVQVDSSSVPAGQGDRTQLPGYTSDGWPGNGYPGNVQSIDGGALEQHDSVLNDGWIERQGTAAARYIQIDINGRLLRQDSGGFSNLSCDLEAQYQVPGGSEWTDFPFSPMTITNGSTRAVYETFASYLDQPAVKVRVRRTTPDPTDANEVSELSFVRVKFFRDTDALYPAQHREGLIMRATGQLNGQVDSLSALVEMKCWVWNSTDPWDGSMPGTGNGAWVWQASVNPGYLFIYYARGGFLNPAAAPAHLGLAGWLDAPDPGNSDRIFGAGLTNDEIDYATLVAWAQWCASQNLECYLSVTDNKSVDTVLSAIAAAGRARKSWAPGKLSVWWEAPGQPSIAAFGCSNIVAGTFKIAYDTDDSIDGYVMSYTQVDNDFQAGEVRATLPGVTQPVNWQSSDAAYSMTASQAQRTVNLLAAGKHYFHRTMTWESGAFGLTVATGDVIQLAHDLTRWAYSGRLVSLTVADGLVREVTLSAEVEAVAGDTDFWLMVTPPGGDPVSYRCTLPAARTRTLTVLSTWSSVQAPGWLDQSRPNPEADEFFDATIPEDWTWLAGPTVTPGKRVRIIGTEPSSERRVRITARDEVAEYYALENGLDNVPDVPSGERIVARLFNLSAEALADGGHRVTWELQGAIGARLSVFLNSGPEQQVPVAGQLTVEGSELVLPRYADGTRLRIHALPVAAGTPVAIEGDQLELVVSGT